MATTVIENRHYYAFCRDCPYTGPLRFRRELAAADAEHHRATRHDLDDELAEIETEPPSN